MMDLKKEQNILHQLVKSREAIRKKYNLLKQNRAYAERVISKTLKPITDPLNELVSLSKTKSIEKFNSKNKKNFFNSTRISADITKHNKDIDLNATYDDEGMRYESAFDDNEDHITSDTMIANETPLNEYLKMLQHKTSNLDKLYGVHKKDSKFYFGNSEILFNDNDIIVQRQKYPNTIGLLELLFKKDPNRSLINEKDLNIYRQIVEITNIHRKKFEKNGEFRRHNSRKYDNIIAPLFEVVTGEGLQTEYKVARFNSTKDYIYWDDPNELVDRLRLLLAERSAGNNAHSNEISSIIEELREGGYIY